MSILTRGCNALPATPATPATPRLPGTGQRVTARSAVSSSLSFREPVKLGQPLVSPALNCHIQQLLIYLTKCYTNLACWGRCSRPLPSETFDFWKP